MRRFSKSVQKFQKFALRGVLAAAMVPALSAAASAVPVDQVIFKLSDAASTGLDAFAGWTNSGSFNEGNASAALLNNNGLDYKSSLVDSWPASFTNIRVAFYSGGVEQAYIDFDPTGTTKNDFFTQANVVGSTWSDITGSGNFFSIPGHTSIGRHWFVNNNYGGCGNDVGHMVVIDSGTVPCTWEQSRDHLVGDASRAFLYSTATTEVNWNTSNVGVADVFAVIATMDVPAVPAPGAVGLIGLGLIGLGVVRRRKR